MRKFGLVALLVALMGLGAAGVRAQDDGVLAVITSPAEGQQLFGVINIVGSAQYAGGFDSYTLEYNDQSDPNAPWLLVQPRVQQQVTNDVLGTWNTNVVPDGLYRLRLRVFLPDGSVGGEFVVANLQVLNSAPTPVPTVGNVSGAAPLTPTAGPSPTPLIQQPPSNNPDANVTGGLDAAQAPPALGAPTALPAPRTVRRVNTARVRSAFCSGVYLALGAFGVMLLYLAVRGRLRPRAQRWMWQIEDDFERDEPY